MAETAPATQPELTRNKLYLIDGSGFLFRAYHAPAFGNDGKAFVPTSVDGTPVKAVMLFCNILVKLLQEIQATHIAVIFDAGKTTFRNAIYPEYKAHRPDMPEDLVPQVPLVREATRAFGLPCIELEGFEADDLIASYACAARNAGQDVVIVSGDKDLMQLVGQCNKGSGACTTMLDPLKNKIIDIPEVFEKFGVTPDLVVDVQSLAGDSVDNVPGVPGIGIKTAAELINTYGSLEALLERTDEIKQPKRREALQNHAEAARISKLLVKLDCNTPLPLPLEQLVAGAKHDLPAFMARMRFRTLAKRLGMDGEMPPRAEGEFRDVKIDPRAMARTMDKPLDVASSDLTERATKLAATPHNFSCIQDEAALAAFADKIRAAGIMTLDCETDGLTPSRATLVGLALAVEAGDHLEAAYVPLAHKASGATGELDLSAAPVEQIKQVSIDAVQRILGPLLADESILKIAHNMKFDLQVLQRAGLTAAAFDDTMLLSYVMAAGIQNHGCDALIEQYFQHKMTPYKELCGVGKKEITFDYVGLDCATAYAAEDAHYTYLLWKLLKPEVAKTGLSRVYERLERPLVPIVATMEATGIKLDPAVLRELSSRFGTSLLRLEEEIFKVAGQPFNIGSPKQLGEILFDTLKLPGGTRGKTGAYSTGIEVLEPLAEQGHDVAVKILEWRALSKLRSTYTEALLQQIGLESGRVHTSYQMASTSTGRLSSADPNLQNIPIRTEDGREIRRAFVADPGCKLIAVDYSQIELRLIASMAEIPAMIEAFRTGADIHALTAAQVHGIPLAEVTPALRRSAKAINFGIIYGISGFGLAKQIGVSNSEAAAFIRDYLDRFPELRAFMEAKKQEARDKGYIETLFGRRCFAPGINDRNPGRRAGAERQAINAPIQGTAADIMKRAMIALPDALAAENCPAKLLLQVHDELVLEAPEAEAERAAQIAVRVMSAAAPPELTVPLECEYGIADNWAAAH